MGPTVDCRSRLMAISLDVAGILQDPNEFANKRRGDKGMRPRLWLSVLKNGNDHEPPKWSY